MCVIALGRRVRFREPEHRRRVREPQRLFPHESFQGLDAQGELAARERTFGANVARSQAFEVGGQQVFGAVDDAEVLRAAALVRWPQNLRSFASEILRGVLPTATIKEFRYGDVRRRRECACPHDFWHFPT
jgi:hypothetical protein